MKRSSSLLLGLVILLVAVLLWSLRDMALVETATGGTREARLQPDQAIDSRPEHEVRSTGRPRQRLPIAKKKKAAEDGFFGRIVDSRGHAVANAEVRVFVCPQFTASRISSTQSDAEGYWRFEHARWRELDERADLLVTVRAEGFQPRLETINCSLDSTSPAFLEVRKGRLDDIVLERGPVLRGWIIDARGKAVAGAKIEYCVWPQSGGGSALHSCEAISDQDGYYEVTASTEPGRGDLDAYADDIGTAEADFLAPTTPSVLPILMLRGQGELHGTVKTKQGTPIADAFVDIEDDGPAGREGLSVVGVRTDANGKFHCKGLSPGPYQVFVSEPDMQHSARASPSLFRSSPDEQLVTVTELILRVDPEIATIRLWEWLFAAPEFGHYRIPRDSVTCAEKETGSRSTLRLFTTENSCFYFFGETKHSPGEPREGSFAQLIVDTRGGTEPMDLRLPTRASMGRLRVLASGWNKAPTLRIVTELGGLAAEKQKVASPWALQLPAGRYRVGRYDELRGSFDCTADVVVRASMATDVSIRPPVSVRASRAGPEGCGRGR